MLNFHESGHKKLLYNPHPWKSVTIESDGKTGDVQREEDSVQESNGCSKRMSDSCYGLGSISVDASGDSRENIVGSPSW